jgi:hypothetical protein
LLALFTHNHAFWIAGLLLALVPPLPDFLTPLTSIARSLHRMSRSPEATAAPPLPPAAATPLPLPQAPPPDADRSGVQQGN